MTVDADAVTATDTRASRSAIVACAGAFAASLSTSLVAVVTPVIARELGATPSHVSWVLTAYLVTVSVCLIPAGRLADAFGRRRAMLVGFAVFALASLACTFARSLPALIAARVVQGVGGSVLMATGPAVITAAFAPSRRGRALGIQLAVTYIGLTIGPTVGGTLARATSWSAVFACVAAFAALGFVLAMTFLERDAPTEGARVDVLRTIANLLRTPAFTLGVLGAVLLYTVTFVLAYLLPFELQTTRGFDAQHAGLLMTAQPATMSVVAPFSGWVMDRFGPRVPTVVAMLLIATGLVLVGRTAGGSDTSVALALAVVGAGAGLYVAPNSAMIMAAAPRDRQSTAAAFAATARNIGMAVGVSFAALLRVRTSFGWALGAAAALAVCGAAFGMMRPVVRA